MKSIYDVVNRALADPVYAADIAGKAARASKVERSREILKTSEWSDLLAEFADGPEELAKLTVVPGDAVDGATSWTLTTTSTLTTTTTFPCLTTTTTSVSTTITATMEQ